MQNYSGTQAANIAVIAGAISIILAKFNIGISSDEVQTIIGAVLIIIAVAYNWYKRYKQGDLTPLGFRKF